MNKMIQNLILCLLSTIITLCAFELIARGYASISQKQRSVTYDALLGWKLIPGIRKNYDKEEKPYLIRTNYNGFRDKEYSYEKPSTTYRIIAIGNSFVFGSGGVANEELFTKSLRRLYKMLK